MLYIQHGWVNKRMNETMNALVRAEEGITCTILTLNVPQELKVCTKQTK